MLQFEWVRTEELRGIGTGRRGEFGQSRFDSSGMKEGKHLT